MFYRLVRNSHNMMAFRSWVLSPVNVRDSILKPFKSSLSITSLLQLHISHPQCVLCSFNASHTTKNIAFRSLSLKFLCCLTMPGRSKGIRRHTRQLYSLVYFGMTCHDICFTDPHFSSTTGVILLSCSVVAWLNYEHMHYSFVTMETMCSMAMFMPFNDAWSQ